MTLVLGVIAPEFAVIAADQRLTQRDDASLILGEDAVKVTVFNHHTVFGYTGAAKLPRSRRVQQERGGAGGAVDTNQWIAEVLALETGGLEDRLDTLRKEAEAMRVSGGLGIMGIGFAGTPLLPFAYLLSNLNPEGRFQSQLVGIPREYRYLLVQSAATGQPFEHELMKRLRQIFRGPRTASLVGDALGDVIRTVSEADGSTVGGGVLEACIPKIAVQRFVDANEMPVANARPNPDWLTIHHQPTPGQSTKRVSPTFVAGGNIFLQALLPNEPIIFREARE